MLKLFNFSTCFPSLALILQSIEFPSCSDGKGSQPATGHPAGLRRTAGMPGGGIPVTCVLLAEGSANLEWIRQRLGGQLGVRLARSRNAARRVSFTEFHRPGISLTICKPFHSSIAFHGPISAAGPSTG